MDTDFAWAAGFFDGEGHTGCHDRANRKKTPLLRMCISQKDRRLLDRFRDIVGTGKVYERRNQPACPYQWYIGRPSEVERVLALLDPYLGEVKREQARAAIDHYRQLSFVG